MNSHFVFVQVIKKAAEKKELVQVALNTHGTRAVQKLIETLTNREQVITAFRKKILAEIQRSRAAYVFMLVLCCLQFLRNGMQCFGKLVRQSVTYAVCFGVRIMIGC